MSEETPEELARRIREALRMVDAVHSAACLVPGTHDVEVRLTHEPRWVPR